MAAQLASELPYDALVDILLRLPVKSLMRFKCVQKSWLALIESPSFITKHSHQAISRSDAHYLLVKRKLKEIGTNLVTLHPTGAAGNLPNIILPPLCTNGKYDSESMPYILPVCANGIICLTIPFANENTLLCNPTTTEYWMVPENPVSAPADLDAYIACIGFAYDTKTDDYKFIRVTGFWDDYGTPHSTVVDVYSLKKNLWRRLDVDIEDNFSYRSGAQCFLNGIYHWLAYGKEPYSEQYYFIRGFDISEETFSRIEFPDILFPLNYMTTTWFTDLNNSIALIISTSRNMIEEEESFEIWVMNEYGVKESWEKKFTIGPLSPLPLDSPLGFWNNEKFLLKTSNGNILQYDLETGEIEILDVNGDPSSMEVLNYTASLISIKAIKGDN